MDISGLPALSSERAIHEVEVLFPGDAAYYGSKAICYLPTNPPAAKRRTISAVLSKSTVRVGDTVIAEVTVTEGGGRPFWVEGEGFGMPACQGEIDDQGKGSCFFKIGGMALAGERILGIYVSSSQNLGAASTHLALKVLDDSDSPQPPNRPSPPANFEVVGKE